MTVGEEIWRLTRQAGRTQKEVARRAGYAASSSVQKYYRPDYEEPLPFEISFRLAAAIANDDPDHFVPHVAILRLANILPPDTVFTDMVAALFTPDLFLNGHDAAVDILAAKLPEAFARALTAFHQPDLPRK